MRTTSRNLKEEQPSRYACIAFWLKTILNGIYDFNRCRFPQRLASASPELIIACDVRGRGEWLHRCSWPPLQLASAAYKLFAHAFRLQRDRQTEGQTSRPGYIFRLRKDKMISYTDVGNLFSHLLSLFSILCLHLLSSLSCI